MFLNKILRDRFSNATKDIISFFGASVTRQSDGYAVYLSKKLDVETHIFGYGGNHLNDAGICFIDKVINANCNYCFIDWFSTGYISVNDLTTEYLDTIVCKFTKARCKLIFLFLLDQYHKDRINFNIFLKSYLNSKNLYYIDINDYLEFSSEYIRDSVHTTEFGSKTYADIIYNSFTKDKHKIELPSNVTETRFCGKIKALSVNKIFKDSILIEGKCLIIGFYLFIGRKSGLVDINGEKYKVWDQWCHYDREHFNLKGLELNGNMEIKILQEDPDYSLCRRDFTETNIPKELNIIDIYYVGDNLQIVNAK